MDTAVFVTHRRLYTAHVRAHLYTRVHTERRVCDLLVARAGVECRALGVAGVVLRTVPAQKYLTPFESQTLHHFDTWAVVRAFSMPGIAPSEMCMDIGMHVAVHVDTYMTSLSMQPSAPAVCTGPGVRLGAERAADEGVAGPFQVRLRLQVG